MGDLQVWRLYLYAFVPHGMRLCKSQALEQRRSPADFHARVSLRRAAPQPNACMHLDNAGQTACEAERYKESRS